MLLPLSTLAEVAFSTESFLFRPGRGAEYCYQPVCVYVCLFVCLCVCLSVREHISGIAGRCCTDPRNIFCADPMWPWLSPPPVVLGCAALCTSDFMDDVMCGRNGRDVERWRLIRAATAMHYVRDRGGV